VPRAYYPESTAGTALYNISSTANKVVLDRIHKVYDIEEVGKPILTTEDQLKSNLTKAESEMQVLNEGA